MSTDDKKEPQNGDDRVLITLVHRDTGQRAFSLWLDENGNVTVAPEGDRAIEPNQPPDLMLTFKKNQPMLVSPQVAEYMLSLKHRVLGGPADIELPLFIEGEPPAQEFAELPIDEQVGSIHGQLGVVEQRVADATDAVRQVARHMSKGPSDVSEVFERQERVEANVDRLATLVEGLVESLGPQKPAKKARKKRRGRPPKAKAAAAKAKAEDRAVEESPASTPEPDAAVAEKPDQEMVLGAAVHTG